MGISFEQIRTATNPGLEDDGSGAMRIKTGFGVTLTSQGLDLSADEDSFKMPVRVHQSTNVTLSGGAPDTVDGVGLALNDRVLVSGQTTPSEDGLYEVTTLGTGSNGTWQRTADAPTGSEAAGWYIPVLEGTSNSDKLFRVVAAQGGATVGTDGWTVAEIGSTSAATLAGAGLVVNGAALDVNTGSGLEINADTVRIAAAAAGNGLAGGGGSALSVDSDTESGGNIQGVTVGANGVGVDISAIAGNGLGADGSANLEIDVNSTVNFSAATPVWTFGNETTGEGLFVTGTPVDGNHVVNKTYVDNVVSGLKWIEPVSVGNYLGTRTVTQINALTPSASDAVVAGDAGTPSAGTSDVLAAGDIAEFDGTSWKKIVSNSGGFPPAGTRAVAGNSTLYSPLTDVTDDNKVATWGGTSLTPSLSVPQDGWALLAIGEGSVLENLGFVYDNSPAGWVQFTGVGQITAGDGISKVNQTLSVTPDTTSTGGTASVVAVTGSGVAVRVDNSSIEGSAANGNLRVKGLGITNAMLAGSIEGTKLNANTVAFDRLNIRFRRESIAASSFTDANPSTADLSVAALIGTNEDQYNVLDRNGLLDMQNVGNAGTPSGATQYKVDNSGAGSVGRITIGANINATGNVYGIQYLSVT